MASNKPIPSRAALHALRGAILTTSCSVILLAEERRRRLQIARVAIENARKLHTVQCYGEPAALAEAHDSWESRSKDSNDHVLSTAYQPKPRTHTRRRRRSHLIGAKDRDERNRGSSEDDFGVGRPHSFAIEDRSSSPISQSAAGNFLGRVLGMICSATAKVVSPSRESHLQLDWILSRDRLRPRILPFSPSIESTKSTGAVTSVAEPVAPEESTGLEVLNSIFGSTTSADLQAPASANDDAIIRIYSERISLAIAIVKKISTFDPVPSDVMELVRLSGIRLFEAASRFSPESLVDLLAAVLPLTRDPVKTLMSFMNVASQGNHQNALRGTMILVSQNPKQYSWDCGMLICRLLARYAPRAGFKELKRLYLMLQDAGLFKEIQVPVDTEYKIRRLLTISSLKHNDDALAMTEFGKLQDLNPNAVGSDARLQQRLITRKAKKGYWTAVLTDIETFARRVDRTGAEVQSLLTEVTDLFAQYHNPYELEQFLRKIVIEHKLIIKHRWIHAVLNCHAERRHLEAICSWLEFCVSTGVSLHPAFHQRFFATCRKYWSFSVEAIRRLEAKLEHDCPFWRQVQSTKAPPSRRGNRASYDLRLAVVHYLGATAGGLQRATNLIQHAHRKGLDVSEAATPLLLAQLESGYEPREVVENALRMGLQIHDSVFNKAAQALSHAGDHQASSNMCELAARENGQGNHLYNEFNFANLIFAYTGSAEYWALRSLLSCFTSDMLWWYGSPVCKESIKLAMKTAAMRAVARPHDNESHQEALCWLDEALVHVKKCRGASHNRQAVWMAYVRLAKKPSASHAEEKMCYVKDRWHKPARGFPEAHLGEGARHGFLAAAPNSG